MVVSALQMITLVLIVVQVRKYVCVVIILLKEYIVFESRCDISCITSQYKPFRCVLEVMCNMFKYSIWIANDAPTACNYFCQLQESPSKHLLCLQQHSVQFCAYTEDGS